MRCPTVLFLDSFDDERDMYVEYLRAEGFEVDGHHDAEDAFRSLAHKRPDVFVTRLRQVGQPMSGIDVVDRVKRATTPPLPVVILTGSILSADRQTAERAHCDTFLLLPVLPDQLATEIRRLISSDGQPS